MILSASMTKLSLNDAQLEAVHHIEGPLLVLAGAGSGKTRIVTMRIAHLIELGVPASEILALTFTNKAAEEMKSRIKALSTQAVLASTFHSLCARILRESIGALEYQTDFTIYDEKDSEHLLKTCLGMLGHTLEKGLLRSMKNAISQAKNDLLSPSEYAQVFTAPEDKILAEAYIAYQQKLKEYNALDFDDLLFLTVQLFQKYPKVLEIYQNRWSFVLIDEYQDTNAAQYTITKLLTQKHTNVCVVGDPDQSIYSWRGANINNILNFETDFPGAKIIKLEENYRSTSHILNAANELIQNNTQRYEKKLWSALGEGEKVKVFFASSDREEAQFVLQTINHYIRASFLSLNDVVIFYRTNAQSRVYEDLFLKHNIPYVIVGGISFYQRREIKDLLSILRLIVSSTDFLSFLRSINLPKRGFGQTTLAKMQQLAEDEEKPILMLCDELLTSHPILKLSKRQKEGLYEFIHAIKMLREMAKTHASLDDILIEAIERTRYLEYLREDPDTYADRKENIDELIAKASEWGEDGNLQDFLEELSLKSSADDSSTPYDSIKLMTLHNGKGLEFDLTFMVGMEEELFPHLNSRDSFEGLEEERRLCYVGMTRAKKHLYMTGSTYRTLWGTPKIMSPSRFISELPDQYTTYLNKSMPTESFEEKEGLDVGMTVFHKNFGTGVIQKAYTTSMGPTYDVFFHEDNTTRSLVAKYAKLTPA